MANFDIEYKEFSAEFGKSFQGDNIKQLKFLLSDYISHSTLENNSVTAIDLLGELAKYREQNKVVASSTKLKLFEDIGELTQLGYVQDLLNELSQGDPSSLHKGVGLKPYRSIFFRGIENADAGGDFFEARAFYSQTQNSEIKDLWDLVLYLEVNDFLVTRKDLNRFADRLSGKSKSIIKDGLKTLVIQKDGDADGEDTAREDTDKLFDLIPVHEDRESEETVDGGCISVQPMPKQKEMEILKYNMTSSPRGICLIINNIEFTKESGFGKRTGSEVDEEYLKLVFSRLGFRIECKHNQTAHEMEHVMNEMQTRDHSQYDCFVCCILSHGTLTDINGSDGVPCGIFQLTSGFQAHKCTSLRSKPKVFFIQACRKLGLKFDAAPENIPNAADFLYGYSTAPLTMSYRNKNHGTFYIRNLTKALIDRYHTDHILDILTHVNYEVSKMTGCQVPSPQYTLRKKLYFPKHEA
ncbi:caspase-8-like [Antedon mediterranea]|uniref:caspase-8-like n=1 Tax=Antedon mediterranea TaxID=105859 RepID=UPI003AF64FA4